MKRWLIEKLNKVVEGFMFGLGIALMLLAFAQVREWFLIWSLQ